MAEKIAKIEDTLIGVWMGISHQTITITSIREDLGFSGTYFTPSMDIRATFAGQWCLDGDILTMNYTESDSSFFRVPMVDLNRIEPVSSNKIILHTHPHGISMEWNRVKFAKRECPQAQPIAKLKAPTLKVLKAFKMEDLENDNPLMSWMANLIDRSDQAYYDYKVMDALQNRIPKKAGYYFCMSQVEGLWGNGGMQQVLLNDQTEPNQYFLRVVGDAYEYFGELRVAKLIRELAAKSIDWIEKIESLNQAEAPEEEFEPIWKEVDSYDDVFDKMLQTCEVNPYETLLEDIRKNPRDYVQSVLD